jgi:hypothetical protein
LNDDGDDTDTQIARPPSTTVEDMIVMSESEPERTAVGGERRPWKTLPLVGLVEVENHKVAGAAVVFLLGSRSRVVAIVVFGWRRPDGGAHHVEAFLLFHEAAGAV